MCGGSLRKSAWKFIVSSFWSAMPVQKNKLVPVFRFIHFGLRSSVLQGTASPGARWPKQHFILEFAGCTHFVNKPDGSGSPEA